MSNFLSVQTLKIIILLVIGLSMMIIFSQLMSWAAKEDTSRYNEMKAKCEHFLDRPVGEISVECAKFYRI